MYKSENHKVETEKWLESIRSKNYAGATIYKKVLEAPRIVYESLQGRTGVEKAQLIRRNIPVVTTLNWDDRAVIPIGTKINVSSSSDINDAGNHYIFESIKDDKTVMLHYCAGKSKTSYSLETLNKLMKAYTWRVVDAIPEHYRIIGVPPKPPKEVFTIERIAFNNNQGAADNIVKYTHHQTNQCCFTYTGTTGNCQLAVMRYANVFINSAGDIKSKLAQLKKNCCKNQILMDVNVAYVTRLIKEMTKDMKACIRVNSPYQSTNGSNMCILVIDLKNMNV